MEIHNSRVDVLKLSCLEARILSGSYLVKNKIVVKEPGVACWQPLYFCRQIQITPRKQF